ncbi:type IV pilus biogenesis/stability protein PilW [Conservatibacter flavescens]|uniref:Type IV pilus biogenesis/stability protein PilW n=1 Tax=Conservatibacter flavescens TaxID=28161 RepID=A0A2M8S3I3_9PAST|nr:type IV pilus biogenesis/stability protein PilW [Conservatibacter flavescens]PJG85657.1 type IV pilus biogenesis/stability protein PilW [Conservatibacter flavescens]
MFKRNFKTQSAVLFSLFLSACVSQQTEPDFDKQQAAKARIELGLGYLHQQNITQAKLNLDKALSHAPNYYLVHSALAYFYQMQGETEKADSAYRTAIKLDSKQGDVLNNYGAFLCGQGEFEQAYQRFQQALNTPNYYHQADTYENLALCNLSAKNTALFQQNLAQLEKIAPERAAKLTQLFQQSRTK